MDRQSALGHSAPGKEWFKDRTRKLLVPLTIGLLFFGVVFWLGHKTLILEPNPASSEGLLNLYKPVFYAIPIGHHDGTTQPRDKWKPENIHYGKW